MDSNVEGELQRRLALLDDANRQKLDALPKEQRDRILGFLRAALHLNPERQKALLLMMQGALRPLDSRFQVAMRKIVDSATEEWP